MDWIAVSGRVVTLCHDLAIYFRKIQDIDLTVAVFVKEIDTFSAVVANVQNTVGQLGESGFINRCGREYWEAIGNSVCDVQDSLQMLELLVKSNKSDVRRSLLQRTKDTIIFDWNTLEIERRRMEIAICRHALMFSLNMVQVYVSLRQD
jgi:hypothetical protein